MLNHLLSNDLPKSRVLTVLLLAIVLGLLLTPFIFPGAKALGVAAKILVFIVLVASYDLLLGYTGPNTTLDFSIMIDILLMVVIGGMGTMYGAVIGATIFIVAQNYLQEAMKALSEALKGVPLLPDLLHPDRWLLWLGVLFVLSVYYFPHGIVGQLRAGVMKPGVKK